MWTHEQKTAFAEGVLDRVEGEVPRELWDNKRHREGLEKWRERCLAGLIANWHEFFDNAWGTSW